jgi:hypothetical protein
MTDDPPNEHTSEPGQTQPAPWLRATFADLVDFDFEAPIAESKSANTAELSDLFRIAANPAEDGQTPETPAGRVFSMLWAVTGMEFRPKEPNEPFGAMTIRADGRRSALISADRPSRYWLRSPVGRNTQFFVQGSLTSPGFSNAKGLRWVASRQKPTLRSLNKSMLARSNSASRQTRAR